MSPQVMSPVAVTYIGCGSCEIGLESEGRIIDIGIAGEAYLITMASQTTPAMENQRATVGSVLLHLIEEYVVAPECLTKTFYIGTCKILLPVEPPEVDTLLLEGAYEVFKESLGEFLILKVPGYEFLL